MEDVWPVFLGCITLLCDKVHQKPAFFHCAFSAASSFYNERQDKRAWSNTMTPLRNIFVHEVFVELLYILKKPSTFQKKRFETAVHFSNQVSIFWGESTFILANFGNARLFQNVFLYTQIKRNKHETNQDYTFSDPERS